MRGALCPTFRLAVTTAILVTVRSCHPPRSRGGTADSIRPEYGCAKRSEAQRAAEADSDRDGISGVSSSTCTNKIESFSLSVRKCRLLLLRFYPTIDGPVWATIQPVSCSLFCLSNLKTREMFHPLNCRAATLARDRIGRACRRHHCPGRRATMPCSGLWPMVALSSGQSPPNKARREIQIRMRRRERAERPGHNARRCSRCVERGVCARAGK